MRKVRFALIIASRIKSESKELAFSISSFLKEREIDSKTIFIDSTEGTMITDENVDLIVALGGDGTVLYAARASLSSCATVLPINLGTFGYIAEIGKEEWKESLDEYLNGENNLSERIMLSVKVLRCEKEVFSAVGLNEAVISSSGIAKVINLNLAIDHTYAGRFRSDGMIIATPTGSTGYSLASGGPILEGEMKALVITPICPFTLSNRPLVTGNKEIVLYVEEDQRTDIVLTVDGQVYFELKEKDKIVIEMSDKKLNLIRSMKRNFTEVIREKLHWAGK